jgi:hypothetical protein
MAERIFGGIIAGSMVALILVPRLHPADGNKAVVTKVIYSPTLERRFKDSDEVCAKHDRVEHISIGTYARDNWEAFCFDGYAYAMPSREVISR